jgi:hypothetical protein
MEGAGNGDYGRRRLTMAEIAPASISLFLVKGETQEGYVLRADMNLLEAVRLFRRILADDVTWISWLLEEPWSVTSFGGLKEHGSIEIVLPEREGGWPL